MGRQAGLFGGLNGRGESSRSVVEWIENWEAKYLNTKQAVGSTPTC